MPEPPLNPGPLPALRQVVEALNALGVGYYIGGSIASSVHGVFRQTSDTDFVAALTREHVDRLVSSLKENFYIDPESVREAIAEGGSFNVIYLQTMEKCDVFVMRPTEWGREQMSTRVSRPVYPGVPDEVWLGSPACTVLQKLLWFQASGGVSDRQWGDLLGVLKTQGRVLDTGYLRLWAGRIGVSEELERALKQAGPG